MAAEATMSDAPTTEDAKTHTFISLAKELGEKYDSITERESSLAVHTKATSTNTSAVVADRHRAEKWETIMAALAQAYIVMYPMEDEDLKGSKIWYPLPENISKGANAVDLEAEARIVFDQRNSHLLTPEVIENLENVWLLWSKLIKLAGNDKNKLKVFKMSGYGFPHLVPWLEFVAIATLIANHYRRTINSTPDGAKITFSIDRALEMLRHISQLRRYLRMKIHSSGYRRSDNHWAWAWTIITWEKGVITFGESRFKPFKEFEEEPRLRFERVEDAEEDDKPVAGYRGGQPRRRAIDEAM